MGLLENVKKALGIGDKDQGDKDHAEEEHSAPAVPDVAGEQAAREPEAGTDGARQPQEAQEGAPEGSAGFSQGAGRITEVVVEHGDTMSGIAAQFGVDLGALIASNADTVPNPDFLYPGQVLRLP
ncbi:LysM peptidoglycan-binding domain-containing protein [Paenarthrobacter sp. UW852]|uniref:LysM peptidoglycan-binding domain-containing protein n=1 Tax=Paenarthrobacter sp. UW852 TaxID=2951989 RepID=UPI0021474F6A|nr:LysM peptidoglycan-binding domain-containing protein [Paenarthrobacter sp. UW852]MCR1162744.1 LysM peptidoglycan-binding domain-containing protein [Paenarthrobacter sp. UW852]